MKAGEVMKIRVSPEDVMSSIDLVRAAGIHTTGMSLAQVIRLAHACAMNHLREKGVVPKRDGFEYTEMLRPFKGPNAYQLARRVQITQVMDKADAQRMAQDMPTLGQSIPVQAPSIPTTLDKDSVAYKRKQLRMRELAVRKRADPLNWSPEEGAEFDRLFDEGIRP